MAAQLDELRERFGLQRLMLVGDRGMLTASRIVEDLKPLEAVDRITALKKPGRSASWPRERPCSAGCSTNGTWLRSAIPGYPGERLIACYNPLLAGERKRKRQELLAATEKKLDEIAAATERAKRPLRGEQKIALRAGKPLGRSKAGKHFRTGGGEAATTAKPCAGPFGHATS